MILSTNCSTSATGFFILVVIILFSGCTTHKDPVSDRSIAPFGNEKTVTVALLPVEPVAADGSVPVVIKISERKRRVIGASAHWSSVDGLNASVYWKHRNLFGRGELFRIGAGIGRLDGSGDLDDIDANFSLLLSQPGFFGPDDIRERLYCIPEIYLKKIKRDSFIPLPAKMI